jgi:hypothetical protein
MPKLGLGSQYPALFRDIPLRRDLRTWLRDLPCVNCPIVRRFSRSGYRRHGSRSSIVLVAIECSTLPAAADVNAFVLLGH